MSWILFPLLVALVVFELGFIGESAGLPVILDTLLAFTGYRFLRTLYQAIRDLLKRPEYETTEAIMQTSKRQAWAIIRLVFCLIGISGMSIWFSRWFQGWGFASSLDASGVYRPYLDLAVGCAVVLEMMKLRRVSGLWNRLDLTPARLGVFFYIGVSILGTWMLLMPLSLKPGVSLSFINSFFVSISAITVTGLSPINLSEVFSTFGLWTIILLMQVGGLGIAVLSVLIVSVARQRLSLLQSKIGQELYSVADIGDVSNFVKNIVLLTLVVEAIGAVIIFWDFPSDFDGRFTHAVFHSVSAFCNAGLSSLPTGMELPGFVLTKIILGILIILGGIGFPVIFEVYNLIAKRNRFRTPLSTGSLIAIFMTAFLIVGGFLAIWGTESYTQDHEFSSIETAAHSLFVSIASRTAGFNTIPVPVFSLGSQFLIVILMVIGASPISTGGGLKTTTIALFVIAVYNFFKGNKWIQFYRREIPYYVLHKCVAIVFCYFFLLVVAVGFLAAVEDISLWEATFESVSALSTVGLSLGITSSLSAGGKILLMILMFAGRYGLVSLVFAGLGRINEQRYRYPAGDLYVG